MRFAAPGLLVLLLVVPAAVALLWWLDRHRDERVAKWAPAGLLANMVKRPNGWHRWLPTALLLVGLTLLLVGFARPQAKVHVKRQDATVVLVLDTSGSMAAKDSPPTRLGAARAAALRVVDKVPKGYRIAVVTFTDHAAVVQTPTQDRSLVRAVLARARTGDQGTALGEAVGRAVAVARTVHAKPGSPRPPAIAIVFSDGGQTAGTVTPQQAGRRAALARVPVSTVSVGTADGIVQQQLRGGFTERIQVPVQPGSLQTIAQSSGGRYFPRAVDFNPSGTVSQLGSRVGKEPKRVEVAAAAAAGGLVFMLAGGLLSGVWFRRIV